jgi:uncharacterized phiE125 gp8 family phage protein
MPVALKPVRTVAPASPLFSLAEARAWVKVEGPDEDAILTLLIDAATAQLDGWEGILGRCLVTQTWRQDFDGFGPKLRLPLAPLVEGSVSVTYRDEAGATQTANPALYHVVTDVRGPVVRLADGQSWPAAAVRPDAVSVTARYGYGAPADVPAAIRFAAFLAIADGFRNRESQIIGTIVAENLSRNMALAPFRRVTT